MDPNRWEDPTGLIPRERCKNHAFGAGIHFCLVPLARMEMQIALKALFDRRPNLRMMAVPQYANVYHFHGLDALWVQT